MGTNEKDSINEAVGDLAEAVMNGERVLLELINEITTEEDVAKLAGKFSTIVSSSFTRIAMMNCQCGMCVLPEVVIGTMLIQFMATLIQVQCTTIDEYKFKVRAAVVRSREKQLANHLRGSEIARDIAESLGLEKRGGAHVKGH